MSTSPPFKWRHFHVEIILLNVRWYLRYGLSYRDLEEMVVERGIEVDHTTSERCRFIAHYWTSVAVGIHRDHLSVNWNS